MRIGMMVAVSMLAAATAGMAHGETGSRGLSPSATIRTLGVCEPMANLPGDPIFGVAGLDIAGMAADYFNYFDKQTAFKGGGIKVTLLQPPAHGELSEILNGTASYKPARGFAGQDKIVALVELGGYQVKVVYFIKVQPEGTGGISTDDEEMIKEFCGSKGRKWKISLLTTPLTLDNAARYAS